MKLRLRENSVRIRVTQTEVARLATGQPIEQVTRFTPTTQLTCRVVPSSAAASVSFDRDCLSLLLPNELIHRWASTQEVGISLTQRIDDEQTLSILIEKDFECLHPGHEVNEDAFPNPRK
jgi:hypothetical protein